MWLNAYLEETLLREQLAAVRQRAARHHLLRDAAPPRPPRDRRRRGWLSWLVARKAVPAPAVR
jgi:hypothetical protein